MDDSYQRIINTSARGNFSGRSRSPVSRLLAGPGRASDARLAFRIKKEMLEKKELNSNSLNQAVGA